MKLTWLGTAGFDIQTQKSRFLVDPFLSRSPGAAPEVTITAGDIRSADHIFITHGHFDHVFDVPQIAEQTHARIFSAADTNGLLNQRGVQPGQLTGVTHDRQSFDFDDYCATAFFSTHIRFDLKLVLFTLFKINFKLFSLLPLARHYPCGQAIGWQFQIEGRTLLFFGSAGTTPAEFDILKTYPVDILLIPLQGHTDICRIGIEYVRQLKPKTVIPHHFDNCSPPISQTVDIRPFVEQMETDFPQTEVIVPTINKTLTL